MMRIILFVLTFFLMTVTFNPMAHADRFYFYKQADKALKNDARFDTYYFTEVRGKLPGAAMTFDLPKRRSNKSDEISLAMSFVAQSMDTYYLFIENFSIRDDQKIYPLQKHGGNITPEHPRYDQITAYESAEGKVRTKYEIRIDGSDSIRKSLDPSFYFNASPLPKRLYLDYKFRIRKEGVPEEVFEGTVPLELTSYTEGLWETMWK